MSRSQTVSRLALFALLLAACAGKDQEVFNPRFAANRRVALLTPAPSAAAVAADLEAIRAAIADFLFTHYQISAKGGNSAVADLPQAIFEAAQAKSDDLFWLSLRQDGGGKLVVGNVDQGQSLATLDFSPGELIPFSPEKEKGLKNRLATLLEKGYNNPNDLPKLNLLASAQRFYEQKDCSKALPLYRQYLDEHSVVYITEIQQRGEIQQRVDECAHKVAVMERVRDDQGKGFSLAFSPEGLSEKFAALYRKAILDTGLEGMLKKYTLKPAFLQVRYNAAGRNGTMLLRMRFHQTHYQRMVEKKPPQVEGHRILYLSPYYSLFQKLIALRDRVAAETNGQEKETLAGFDIFFRLEKLSGDFVEMPVEAASDGTVKPPSQVTSAIAGFQPSSIQTQDLALSKQTGYFYLGEPELISGQKTEYGILYAFFELK